MAKRKDRSNTYWVRVLERDHPAIYAQWKAGKIPSVRAARIKAGLLRKPGALDHLKRGWKKSTSADRKAFLEWVKRWARPAIPARDLVEGDGRLKRAVIEQIRKLMADRRLKTGEILAAMGFKKLDPTLGMVLARRWMPNPRFLNALAKWLNDATM